MKKSSLLVWLFVACMLCKVGMIVFMVWCLHAALSATDHAALVVNLWLACVALVFFVRN